LSTGKRGVEKKANPGRARGSFGGGGEVVCWRDKREKKIVQASRKRGGESLLKGVCLGGGGRGEKSWYLKKNDNGKKKIPQTK